MAQVVYRCSGVVLFTEELPNRRQQAGIIHWFLQECLCTRFNGAVPVGVAVACGNDNDRDHTETGVGLLETEVNSLATKLFLGKVEGRNNTLDDDNRKKHSRISILQ